MTPIPFDENQRLAALYAYDVLDTPSEPGFDRITRLAARHFDVPIALISLVDPLRQWFKSKVGLDAGETPREISFCGHAILTDEVFQVADATEDPRFSDTPLVTGPPGIRFYAGAPLIAPGGFRLGTLCVIDRRRRRLLTEIEQETLQDLAAMVVAELEQRRLGRRAAPAEQQTETSSAEPRSRPNENGPLLRQARHDSIAALSHELRTPLNAILGFSEVIHRQASNGAGNPTYGEYAGLIHESAEHLLTLVNRILDQAKSQRIGLDLDEQWFKPADVIARALRMFAEQASGAGVELQSGLEGTLPWLKADRLHLMQMLANIIGNAIKFTRSGGSIRVTAELERNGTLALCVADSGIGIARDNVGQAPVSFGHIENELTRRHQGNGLGLPLCKRLIELHGGELAIASAVHNGTTITLRFPAYRLAASPPENAAAGGDAQTRLTEGSR